MILDIYKDALEYSMQDGIALLKLGLMCLFSFLIIPIFLVSGYSYRVMEIATRGMINGGEKLPYFDDAISMFVDGVKVSVVNLVYMIVPIIVLGIFIAIGISLPESIGFSISMIGLIVYVILALISFLFSIIAVAHMAANDGSMRAAFDIKAIFEIIKSIGWVRYIGFYIGLLIIMFVIAAVVAIVLMAIFFVIGGSTWALGLNVDSLVPGIIGVGGIVSNLIFLFIVGPYLTILEARSVGLVYNLQ